MDTTGGGVGSGVHMKTQKTVTMPVNDRSRSMIQPKRA